MKTKLLLPTLFLSFFSLLLHAQTQFQRTTGTPRDDRNYHLAATKGGNLIATGHTADTAKNGDDAYLLKFNKLGKVQWAYTYGDAGDDYSWDVNVTRSNQILACGNTTSFGTPKSASTITLSDSNGTVIWLSALYTTSLGIEFYRAMETSSGHFVATGLMNSASNGDEIVLAKFSPKGYLIWVKTIGSGGDDEAMGLMETSTGHYLISGVANDANGFGKSDFAAVKTDTAGRVVWSHIFGGSSSERLNTAYELNNNFYFVGWSSSAGSGEYDVFVVKTDSAGKISDVNAYGSSRSELVFNMLYEGESNSFILAGYTEKFSAAGQSDNRNSFLLKLNADNGKVRWTETFGGKARDGHWPTGLAANGNDLGYYMLGSTTSFGLGVYDLYLVKTDSAGNGGCNQKHGDFVKTNVKGWSTKSFGNSKMTKQKVAWTRTSITGKKWHVVQRAKCCALYAEAGKSDTLCPGDEITLGSKALGGYNYAWFNSGKQIANTAKIKVKSGEAGNYSLVVSASAPGCNTATDIATITDDKGPHTAYGKANICENSNITIKLWGSFEDNEWFSVKQNMAVDTGKLLVANAADTFLWHANTVAGCKYSDTVVLQVFEYPTLSLPDTIGFCAGDSQYVKPTTNAPYEWENTTVADTGIWLQTAGYHYVVAVSHGQCSVRDSVWTSVYELPKPDLGADSTACYNAEICLGFNPPYYQTYWMGQKTSRDSFCTSEKMQVTVMVYNEHYCVGHDTINLKSFSGPLNLIPDDSILTHKMYYQLMSPEAREYAWTGAGITQTVDSQTVTIATTGWYYLSVIDMFGCAFSDSIYVDFATGLETAGQIGLSIYPNPAKNWLQISANETMYEIRVYTLSGASIYTNTCAAASHTINLSAWPAGSYLLQVKTKNAIVVNRVVVGE
ncbi:T9SS type A sorting domain-containing protein [bacterium]|nr:T9SS type A sorting domain-containing protein [bacterium]